MRYDCDYNFVWFTCCQNWARRKIRSFLRIQSTGGGGIGEEESGGGAGGGGGGEAASDAEESDSIGNKQ